MKNLFLALFVFIILLISSCTPTKTIVDTSCPGYKSIDFQKSDIYNNGIGIMPVLGGNEKEQYRRPMGDAITKYMRVEFVSSKVKSPNEVITTLNNNELTDLYTTSLSNYSISGIIPREMVVRLGTALGVDYLLYTRLLSDTEIGTVSLGNSVQTVSIDEIYVQCQVWDTRIGDVVWEGKGGVAKLNQNASDVIEKTAEGLSKVIGKDKDLGPCEDKKELIRSMQDAVTGTYLAVLAVTSIISIVYLLSVLP